MNGINFRGFLNFGRNKIIKNGYTLATKVTTKVTNPLKNEETPKREEQAKTVAVPGATLQAMNNVKKRPKATQEQMYQAEKFLTDKKITRTAENISSNDDISSYSNFMNNYNKPTNNYKKLSLNEIKRIQEIYGIQAKAKTKKEFSISEYLETTYGKNTENSSTDTEDSPAQTDLEKQSNIRDQQINNLKKLSNIPDELKQEASIEIFKNLFENGLKSKEYSFYTVPLNEEIINKTFKIIEQKNQKINLNTAYKQAVMKYQQSQFGTWGITKESVKENNEEIGSLITIPQTKKDGKYYEERYNVIQTHSCESWCIHKASAPYYITQGNMVIYTPKNGKNNIGFSYEGNKIVEIQTSQNKDIHKDNIHEILNVLKNPDFNLVDLDPLILRTINEIPGISSNDAEAVKNITTNYFSKLQDNIQNAQDENLTQILDTSDLQTLNETFVYNDDFKDKLNKLNTTYLDKLTTDIQNTPDEKLTQTLFTDQLETLNEIFDDDDDDVKDTLNELNAAYFKKLAQNENLTQILDASDLQMLNATFTENDDVKVKDTLNELNAAYFKKLAQNENLTQTLSTYQLEALNEFFVENDDKDVKTNLNTLVNTYLDKLTTDIQNTPDENLTQTLSTWQLQKLNETFAYNDNVKDKLNELNTAYSDIY